MLNQNAHSRQFTSFCIFRTFSTCTDRSNDKVKSQILKSDEIVPCSTVLDMRQEMQFTSIMSGDGDEKESIFIRLRTDSLFENDLSQVDELEKKRPRCIKNKATINHYGGERRKCVAKIRVLSNDQPQVLSDRDNRIYHRIVSIHFMNYQL